MAKQPIYIVGSIDIENYNAEPEIYLVTGDSSKAVDYFKIAFNQRNAVYKHQSSGSSSYNSSSPTIPSYPHKAVETLAVSAGNMEEKVVVRHGKATLYIYKKLVATDELEDVNL